MTNPYFRSCTSTLFFTAIALFAGACAQGQAAAPSAPSKPSINAQAHAILDKGIKAAGFSAPDAQPWHIRANYSLFDPKGVAYETGVLEQWWSAPWAWRRNYTEKKVSGTEWSVSHTKQFKSKANDDNRVDYGQLDQRIANALTNPLSQAENFKSEFAMDGTAGTFSGLVLNCVNIEAPERYFPKVAPDSIFPRYCFDVKDSSLHYLLTTDTLVTYSEFKLLGTHTVATKMDVAVHGRLVASAQITLLEPLAAADQSLLTPAANAVPLPYVHQASDPPLVPVRIASCPIPLEALDKQERGPVAVPVVIRKDGSVKVNGFPMGPWELGRSTADCVSGYKFEPFKVDGDAVDVSDSIIYVYDGKPFKGQIGYGSQPPPPAPAPAPAPGAAPAAK